MRRAKMRGRCRTVVGLIRSITLLFRVQPIFLAIAALVLGLVVGTGEAGAIVCSATLDFSGKALNDTVRLVVGNCDDSGNFAGVKDWGFSKVQGVDLNQQYPVSGTGGTTNTTVTNMSGNSTAAKFTIAPQYSGSNTLPTYYDFTITTLGNATSDSLTFYAPQAGWDTTPEYSSNNTVYASRTFTISLTNLPLSLATTSTSVASNNNPSTYGQSVTFTATVSGGSSPSGTVTFKDGGTTLGTGTLSGTTATFSTSALGAGSHSITAVYGGDANNATSTSSALTQTVNQATTTTAVASNNNPSTYGQSITFTATISGGSSPTGTVTFKDGGTTLGTGTVSGGSATYSTAALGAGSHSITAVYGGDTNNATSTSSALTQTVNQATTTTAVASNGNPSGYGQSVTFTATISGGSSPTGTVTFKDGGTTIGTGTVSGGSATLSTSALTVGSHTITAVYGGDTNNATSTSSGLTQTVNQATTTTSVSSSANPSTIGQSVTFTATVSGGSSPSGTVTFKDGGTTLGTGTVSGGSATFATAALSVGSHSITAVYGGDTNNATSTASALTQTVNQATTTTSVSSSANPSGFGQSVTFTATVSGGSSPSGTVTFKDGGTTLGTGSLLSGSATFSTSSLAAGSHSITAVYGGDTDNATSTSSALTHTVNQATTTTSVSSSANPSGFGQSVTFTATVSGGSSPSGTVTFKDGGTTLGTGTLSGGTATLSTSALALGAHSITAVYGGDSNNATSTSSALTQTVNQATTATAVTSNNNPAAIGQSVTFTATVSGGSSPSGTVTFKDGGTALGTGTLSGGTATFSTSALAAGSHTITAVYAGDANNTASTSSGLTQTVGTLATTTSVTSGLNPSTVGQAVIFTATVSGGSSPTGTVTFKDGAATLGTGTLSGGSTTFSTAALAAGSHAITAVYGGDATNSASTSAALTQTVNGAVTATQAVASTTLTVGRAANAFTPVTGAGGTAPLSYSVAPALPAGLGFAAASGQITGTPSATQVATTYTVTVRDANNATATATFTLAAVDGPTASTAIAAKVLTAGAGPVAFTPVAGAGGAGALTYSIAPALPSGLSLSSSSGTISGTPTAALAATTMTVTVTDANGATASATFSLTVNAGVVATQAIAAKVLTANTAAATFTPVTGSGGTAPLSYAIAPAMPAGLGFDTTSGAVSGTATATQATVSHTVTITDANGNSANASFSLTVNGAVTATVAIADKLVSIGQAQDFQPITFSGGTTPYTIAVAPTLPAGLSLAAATGRITGTPTAAAAATSYTLTATDANGASAAAAFRLTVVAVTANDDEATTPQHTPVTVAVTANDGGGPFSAVAVASAPGRGAAVVRNLDIVYTPDETFQGVDSFTYTVSKGGATSAPATVRIRVEPRPDPSKDPNVVGLVTAQIETAQRFAETQIGNFEHRLETLHGDGYGIDTFAVALLPADTANPADRPQAGGPMAWAPDYSPATDSVRARSVAARSAADGLAVGRKSDRDAAWVRGRRADQPAAGRANDSAVNAMVDRAFSFWTSGAITVGTLAARSSTSNANFRTSGISAGVDYRWNQYLSTGIGIGYGYDKTSIGSGTTRTSGSSYSVVGYTSIRPDRNWFVDGVLGLSLLDYASTRAISGTADTATGSRYGRQVFGSLTFGYEFRGKRWLLSPYGRMSGVSTELDPFTETGGSLGALHYGRQSLTTATASVGLRGRYTFEVDWGLVAPFFRTEYRYGMQGDSKLALNYADLPNLSYLVDLPGRHASTVMIGIGVDMLIDDINLGLEYLYTHSTDSSESQGLRARVMKRL